MLENSPTQLTPSLSDDDPILGRRVGNYVVEKKLGSGGMGAVYRLKHPELPQTWQALKVLTGAAGQSARERFKQEALAAAKVGSHRVVKPLDMGQFDDGIPYIVMEYVAGRSLEDELAERGALPVGVALRIAARVADTMVIAHRESIVHRDLKPANLMLVPEGQEEALDFQVKLLDFGIARASGEIKLARTAESVVMGTPGYWSPEAVAGRAADGRADVFSLGVILFEMLVGELPFLARTVEEAMMAALSTTPAPPASSRRPAHLDPVPAHVDALVAQAMAKDRDARFDMVGLHQALMAALARTEVTGSARLPSVVVPVRPARSEAPTLSPSEDNPRLYDMGLRSGPGANSGVHSSRPDTTPEDAPHGAQARAEAGARAPNRVLMIVAAMFVVALAAGVTVFALSGRNAAVGSTESRRTMVPPAGEQPAPVVTPSAPVATPTAPVARPPMDDPARPVITAPPTPPPAPVVVGERKRSELPASHAPVAALKSGATKPSPAARPARPAKSSTNKADTRLKPRDDIE